MSDELGKELSKKVKPAATSEQEFRDINNAFINMSHQLHELPLHLSGRAIQYLVLEYIVQFLLWYF